jgi:hypothetical protein
MNAVGVGRRPIANIVRRDPISRTQDIYRPSMPNIEAWQNRGRCPGPGDGIRPARHPGTEKARPEPGFRTSVHPHQKPVDLCRDAETGLNYEGQIDPDSPVCRPVI